jgi:2-haloacid dehalogenase
MRMGRCSRCIRSSPCAVTSPPDASALSETWRAKQLEYTWLRALMGQYEDFWAITNAALRFALRRHGITIDAAQHDRLLQAYEHLETYPEVPDALQTFQPNPVVYDLAPQRLGIPKSELLFVSSNAIDVIGSKAFGFQVAWINRSDAPLDELGQQPD